MSRKEQLGFGVICKGNCFSLGLYLAGDDLPFTVLDVEQLRKFTGALSVFGDQQFVGGERFFNCQPRSNADPAKSRYSPHLPFPV